MQFILTEEEYETLKLEADRGKKLPAYDELLELCVKISDAMPIDTWAGKQKPWGCIITARKQGHEWHCDECPVADICPYPHKDWSK